MPAQYYFKSIILLYSKLSCFHIACILIITNTKISNHTSNFQFVYYYYIKTINWLNCLFRHQYHLIVLIGRSYNRYVIVTLPVHMYIYPAYMYILITRMKSVVMETFPIVFWHFQYHASDFAVFIEEQNIP